MTDANEITHALRLWFQAGDVFEVRVLDAVSADWMRPHTESGYFDYEHIPDAAAAIGKLCWPAPGTGFARFSKNRRPPIRKSLPDAGS